ncbi:hypothetical protein H8D51_00295 [bacterium]|nr:hypothetical protein [bacterium]
MLQIFNDPIFLGIFVVLVVIFFFGIIKKLLKLALVVFLAIVIYLAYFHFTDREVPIDVQESLEQGKQAAQQVMTKTREVVEEGKRLLDDQHQESGE